MKHLRPILILIATGMMPALFAAEIAVKSTLESATVFRQGAEIMRTTEAELPAGLSTIVVQDLASDINPSSIQIKVPRTVTLLSAAHRFNHLVQERKTAAYIVLEDSISIVTSALKREQNYIHALQKEEELIVKNQSIGGAHTGVSLDNLQAIAAYTRQRIREIRNELISLREREQDLSLKLQDLNRQLAEESSKRSKAIGEVVIEVSTNVSQRADFEISYVVSGAGWTPMYDIRSESTEKPAVLYYKAAIRQNTGVDWSGVKLTVSTGNPMLSQNRPILNPWYINFMEYVQRSSQKAWQVEGNVMNMAYAGRTAGKDRNGDSESLTNGSLSQYISTDQGQLNIRFEIEIPYDIPTDGRQHMVSMDILEMKTDYQYHAVPKLDRDAFLIARIIDWEDLNLLPGQANIFFEGTYIGESFINPNVAADTLLVSLGRDRRLFSKREKILDKTASAFIGLNKKETFAYRTTIRNNKNVPVEVEILDNVPVSQNKDIVVSVEKHSGASYNEEIGKLTWLVNLKPGESKEIDLVYTVKYPKNKQVPGV